MTAIFENRRVVGIGEAMLEFAPVGDGLYRRGFAGDTLNTCWNLAALLGPHGQVSYLTRVGTDAVSQEMVDFIEASGIGASLITRDPVRTVGLYVISLKNGERSFSYWRSQSAARTLADDADALAERLGAAGLIHVSGITLAVIGETGRHNLFAALAHARAAGARVSFDPNLRRRLWEDDATLKRTLAAMFALTDIALPSFEDEQAVWGDATPERTIERLASSGVREIAVKDGAGPVYRFARNETRKLATTPAPLVVDTTGAGDSFNAGYLAGRLVGMGADVSVELGQSLAAVVIGHPGALPPKAALAHLAAIVNDAAPRV